MVPRKYEQTTRAHAAEETRQRIVAATFSLHDEQGIEATTMKQIAARAGVSIGTVYHHFPAYEDCIRACGEYTAQLIPTPQDALLQNIKEPAERVTRLVQAWFSYYAQSPYLEGVRVLRNKYRVIDEFMRLMEQALDRQVALALQRAPDDSIVAATAAILDVAVYTALARHGLNMDTAVQHIANLIHGSLLAGPPSHLSHKGKNHANENR